MGDVTGYYSCIRTLEINVSLRLPVEAFSFVSLIPVTTNITYVYVKYLANDAVFRDQGVDINFESVFLCDVTPCGYRCFEVSSYLRWGTELRTCAMQLQD
jgi:hypothetical protein